MISAWMFIQKCGKNAMDRYNPLDLCIILSKNIIDCIKNAIRISLRIIFIPHLFIKNTFLITILNHFILLFLYSGTTSINFYKIATMA